MLGLYQEILVNDGILADESIEQIELRLSGLVLQKQNFLEVYNPIYKDIFDFSWVETILKNIRPYGEQYQAWMNSGYQDKSRLLRGKALQEALTWAKNKALSGEDERYLRISQEEERNAEQMARVEAERQASNTVRMLQNLLGGVPQPEVVINEIMDWTNGHPSLTQYIADIIQKNPEQILDIKKDKKEVSKFKISRLINDHLLSNWDKPKKPYVLREIRRIFLQKNLQKGIPLLQTYLNILQSKKISNDNISLIKDLQEIGLIDVRNDIVTISNRIFEGVFSQEWAKKTLTILQEQLSESDLLKSEKQKYLYHQIKITLSIVVVLSDDVIDEKSIVEHIINTLNSRFFFISRIIS